MVSRSRLKVIFLLGIFIFIGIPTTFAKKADAKKETLIVFKELSPSQRVFYLASLIISGRLEEAVSWIHEFEKGHLKLDEHLKNRLQFMNAYLELVYGKPDPASKLFEELGGKYSELDSILPYWVARAQRLAGDPKRAVKTFEKFCGGSCSGSSLSLSNRVIREYANALCDAGETTGAIETFNRLIDQNSKNLDRNLTRLDLIRCQIQKGEASTAYEGLRSLYTQAPAGVPSDQFADLLKRLHPVNPKIPSSFSEADRLSRILALRNQDRWVDAANELKEVWPQLGSSTRVGVRDEAAETFFKARFYREAAEQYEEILKTGTPYEDQKALLEKLASAYARSNQFEKAIQIQKELVSASGDESTQSSRYKIAFLLADANRCEEAVVAFQDFLNRFPNSNKREEASWQKAWCLYRLGKTDQALQELGRIEKEYPKSVQAQRVAYWRYKILGAAGRSQEAHVARENFLENGSYGFYSRWDQLSRKVNKSQCSTDGNTALSARREIPPPEVLFPDRNPKEARILRELLSLGLWEDFLDLYQKGQTVRDLTSAEWNKTFAGWIDFFASSEQVPPELVWAVMREESHFKPQIRSSAGAIGLMQIIPQTGFELAESLKLNSYTTEDLLEPLVNLRFGVHYLAKLLNKFSGNMIYTIAAYNAGPEAVERWVDQRPHHSCDEFIEEIPYRETHLYVQKVLKSLWDYKALGPAIYEANR
jgi:soluble lytic murein transglycosylase